MRARHVAHLAVKELRGLLREPLLLVLVVLTLVFKKLGLMLFGQTNMTKKFGKLMKKIILILN